LSYSERACSSAELTTPLPIAQPVTPSMQPSIHQPSSTLRLGTPFTEKQIRTLVSFWIGYVSEGNRVP